MPDVDDFKAKANTYHHSSRPDKLLHFVYYIPSLTGAKLQTPPQVADRGTTCRSQVAPYAYGGQLRTKQTHAV